MTIVTPLQRHQGMIDMYAGGASYKVVSRNFHVGEHRLKAMIYRYEPGIIRTRSQQANLSAKIDRAFCLADLDQVALGPCASCGCEHVGKVKTCKPQTCGLCVAARAA